MNEESRLGTGKWPEIHDRLDRVNHAIARGFTRDPTERKEILRRRAEALARKPEEDSAADLKRFEAVEFMLADETYGISRDCIQEIIDLREITPVPGIPSFIAGIINLRGAILTVIDIKKFFDLPERGITDAHRVIVIRHGAVEAGLLAGKLLGMRSFLPEEIQSTLPTLTGIRADYLHGVTKDRVVLLDAAKILSDKKLVVDEGHSGPRNDIR